MALQRPETGPAPDDADRRHDGEQPPDRRDQSASVERSPRRPRAEAAGALDRGGDEHGAPDHDGGPGDGSGGGSRAMSLFRPLLRLGPVVAAVVVGKAMLDYLPHALSGDAARYSVALCAALATGSTVGLAGVLTRRRHTVADAPAPAGIAPPGAETPAQLIEAAHLALLDCRSTIGGPPATGSVVRRRHGVGAGTGTGPLTGWSHFMDESRAGARPTAIGTAYGAKCWLLADPADGRAALPALAETLWRLQLSDLGWKARTQSGHGRPEVTALVLGVLSTLGGDPVRLTTAISAFEAALDEQADPVGMSRTYVVSTAVGGLVRAAPGSARLAELCRSLVEGADPDPYHGDLRCWSAQLPGAGRRALRPSVPHTARAVVALSRAERVLGHDSRREAVIGEALRWLIRCGVLTNTHEEIRRPLPRADDKDHELLTVRHFTAALVARALLCREAQGLKGRDALLGEAVRLVCAAQDGGVWQWDNGDRPLWMTYQGLSVVHAYALATGCLPEGTVRGLPGGGR